MTTARMADFKIFGNPRQNESWSAGAVIQGPYIRNHTRTCIEEFLTRNSKLLIVVSTYLPSDEASGEKPLGSFLSPYERSKIAEGVLVFIFNKEPSRDEWREFWRTNYLNQNLQRLTSYIGLCYIKDQGIEFALKIRSDSFLGKRSVIDDLRQQVQKYQPWRGDIQVKGRIVVTGNWTAIHPADDWNRFHVRDHFYFAYTADLIKFFDCTQASTWREGSGILIRSPESALTQVWLADLKIQVKDLSELLQRFFIIVEPEDVELVRLDPREGQEAPCIANYSRYLKEGAPYLKELYVREYAHKISTTREEWESLIMQRPISSTFW